jgi:hypothetical protein
MKVPYHHHKNPPADTENSFKYINPTSSTLVVLHCTHVYEIDLLVHNRLILYQTFTKKKVFVVEQYISCRYLLKQ